VIVASFLAPRPAHPKWRDYLPSLRLLQESCDRLAVPHVVISDAELPGFDVLRAELPEALMPAILLGQAQALDRLDDDILLVGADCVIARSPAGGFAGCDVAVTLGNFYDCRLNTGAIWVRRHARQAAAAIWRAAADGMAEGWGDDQLALAAQFAPLPRRPGVMETRAGLEVSFLDADVWNIAPDTEADPCPEAVVLHFRGGRKLWSAAWCRRHLGFG